MTYEDGSYKYNWVFVPRLRTSFKVTGTKFEFLYNGGEWRAIGKWEE